MQQSSTVIWLSLIILTLAVCLRVENTFADSCPYCGMTYGEWAPWPGERERVEGLRRAHEASCPRRPPPPPPEKSARDAAFNKGMEYFTKGDWDNAIKYFLEALKYDPTSQTIQDTLRLARANKANDEGVEYLNKSDWDNALKYFEEALGYDPNNQTFQKNLRFAKAKKAYDKGVEYYNKKDWKNAIKYLEHARENDPNDQTILEKLNLAKNHLRYVEALEKAGIRPSPEMTELLEELASQDKPLPQNKPLRDKASQEMYELLKQRYSATKKELADPEWLLPKERELIRKAVEKEDKWAKEVWTSIKAGLYPDPKYRPKTLNDLLPGDILLMEPGDSVGNILAVADNLVTGRVFETGEYKAPSSHLVMCVKDPDTGEIVFLDHTTEKDSHKISKEEFYKKYSQRRKHVARTTANVIGQQMWEEANRSYEFGFTGKNRVVCSERMALAIANVADLPFWWHKRKGVVSFTLGDYYDNNHIGKYFIITPLEEE